jgi:SPP1 gp7 family putative phage head morphogenesis protein
VLIDRGRVILVRQSQAMPFIAQRYGEQAAQHHKREFTRQTKAALGVEVPTLDRAVPTKIGHFVNENVSRIRTLGDKTLNDVEDLIARAFMTGQSVDGLAAEIERRFGIAEQRARFLARDQITTLSAQVTQLRHQELGVVTFRWRTRADGRVRPHHAVKHDRIFPYKGSRAPSFMPGDEVGCRCEAIPIFDEIRMKAGIGGGRKRSV